jgi:hypothetical protein
MAVHVSENYDTTQLPKGPVWSKLWFSGKKSCNWVVSISKERNPTKPGICFRAERVVFFVPVSTETDDEQHTPGIPTGRMLAYGVVTNPTGNYIEIRKPKTTED